ncbi:MAG: electron transfer flavoprotein subunit beta/FixA family protein, partial [bacterium]
SDSLYAGSDTYATSKVLGHYLEGKEYDCILTGTHSLDGDTAHVPSQLGDILNLNQMSNIIKIDKDNFNKEKTIVTVDQGDKISTYEIKLPAILSLRKESAYKLPYIEYEKMSLDVSDDLNIVTNKELKLAEDKVGLKGSLTKVANTYDKQFAEKNKKIVENNDEGIDYVYSFLKEKGFV